MRPLGPDFSAPGLSSSWPRSCHGVAAMGAALGAGDLGRVETLPQKGKKGEVLHVFDCLTSFFFCFFLHTWITSTFSEMDIDGSMIAVVTS